MMFHPQGVTPKTYVEPNEAIVCVDVSVKML
jgi:hypothetical protein